MFNTNPLQKKVFFEDNGFSSFPRWEGWTDFPQKLGVFFPDATCEA